ncbi:hypothetical protein [Novosphingobium sp. ZW T3_23]|uniref:hypothetical protein n=1 Tax=Novosphingobium sp. ZW T3_23 TaxID=3378084 RepID=UPI003851F67E
MSGPLALLLNRRPRVERQVLTLLRGGRALPHDRHVVHQFRSLRVIAAREGYAVLSPDARFLGADELVLLAWLAMSQRITAPGCRPPSTPELSAAISRCGAVLCRLNLRLYPLTFYSHAIRA